jgi:hypothetical protein
MLINMIDVLAICLFRRSVFRVAGCEWLLSVSNLTYDSTLD